MQSTCHPYMSMCSQLKWSLCGVGVKLTHRLLKATWPPKHAQLQTLASMPIQFIWSSTRRLHRNNWPLAKPKVAYSLPRCQKMTHSLKFGRPYWQMLSLSILDHSLRNLLCKLHSSDLQTNDQMTVLFRTCLRGSKHSIFANIFLHWGPSRKAWSQVCGWICRCGGLWITLRSCVLIFS